MFSICSTLVMPFWLLLIVAPGWEWTQRLVHSVLIPGILGFVYVFIFATNSEMPEGASFNSLDGVMALFTSPSSVLAGWVHYLAFDLFVGAWEVRDSQRHGLPHLLVVPCVLLTLMLGPAGLLCYSILRGVMRKSTTLVEA
jgi:hypothetical protein